MQTAGGVVGDPQNAKPTSENSSPNSVNSKAEMLPSYYLATPDVCATSERVERAGIEPATFGLQSRRSPS